jgi:hypothetical protein
MSIECGALFIEPNFNNILRPLDCAESQPGLPAIAVRNGLTKDDRLRMRDRKWGVRGCTKVWSGPWT